MWKSVELKKARAGRAEGRTAAQSSERSGWGAPGQFVFPGCVSHRGSDFKLGHGQAMG